MAKMKEESKKKWTKPKLIILTRGKPEEGALAACKEGVDDISSVTMQTNQASCRWRPESGCQNACQVVAGT